MEYKKEKRNIGVYNKNSMVHISKIRFIYINAFKFKSVIEQLKNNHIQSINLFRVLCTQRMMMILPPLTGRAHMVRWK